jgi:radical SAM protein with 4Fe4S-binding SPASM domain
MRLYLEPDEYYALVARCRAIVREMQGTGEKLDKSFFFEAACMPYTRVWLRNTRVNCGIGGAVVSIDASGDLYPCPLLHQAAFKVGNLRDASFAQLVAVAQARYAGITADDLQGCNTCYIKRICGGGCRALSIHSGRGLMGADPYCSVTRDTIEEAFWLA